MPKVTFVKPDGSRETIDIPVGLSVMEGAVKNNVRGIDADCGGACACATCHVYVDPSWVPKVPPKEDIETTMLDFAIDPEETSRLSCQIKVTAALDGLVVRVPKSQH
jgi:ferredoxin, 2Fe-2S